jgi:curved DNA-binding protein CbpA
MSDLYGVLGLSRNASEEEIKAGYRALARRFHPDVNAGDVACAERLREVNRAYETLGNAETRAAYDCDLQRQRADARRRYSIFAATSLATFVLTTTVVSLAVRWHLEAAAPQAALPLGQLEPPPSEAEVAAPPRKQGPNWTTYRNASFGFALRYPAGVFTFDAGQSNNTVQTFVSRDGRATLRILAADNAAGLTPARFRRSLMKKRYAGASFDPAPQREHWFALSGRQGDSVFFERVTFSCDRKSVHGWQMIYPTSERATYDKIAQLVLRNHPHGNGPGAGCREAETRPQARRSRR